MLNINLTSKYVLIAALICFTACKQKETTVSSEETAQISTITCAVVHETNKSETEVYWIPLTLQKS